MKNSLIRRVRVEIDLQALKRNYSRIVRHVAPLEVLGVLKANAYGLGVGAYANALHEAGCRNFGVAEPYEALELRKTLTDGDCSIQILSSVLPDEIAPMVEEEIVLPAIDLKEAKLISEAAAKLHAMARVHIKIDSGMGRLGIPLEDAIEVIEEIKALPNLDCEGIFSHCPMAYDPKDPYTKHQIERFVKLVGDLEKLKIFFRKIHIAASDAINNFPEAFRSQHGQNRHQSARFIRSERKTRIESGTGFDIEDASCPSEETARRHYAWIWADMVFASRDDGCHNFRRICRRSPARVGQSRCCVN